MSASAIIAIAIIVVVLLAAVLFVTNVRRRDTRRAEGVLSRETRAADRSGTAAGPSRPDRPRLRAGRHRAGRAVHRARARSAHAAARCRTCRPTPSSSASPAASSSTAARSRSWASASPASAPPASPSSGRSSAAGSARRSRSARSTTSSAEIRANDNFFYLAEGRTWLTEYPAEALPKAEKVYPPPGARPAWRPASSRSTRSARTSAAACPTCETSQWFECPCHGSQYNRVGEKKGGPAPRGMDRFGVVRSSAATSSSTPAPSSPARRSAPTRPARRPKARTASPAARGQALMVYATAATTVGRDHRCRPHRRVARRTCSGTCATPGPRSAPRSSWRRTASPTSTTRSSRGRSSSARSSFGVAMLVVIGVGLPLYWLAEPGRQAGAIEGFNKRFAELGSARLRHHRRRRLQLRRLPRRHGRHRRRGAVHHHRPEHGRGHAGQLEGPGAQHRALPVLRGRGPLHPHLRPAVLADVAVGHRRRRPDERPADRQPHRLPTSIQMPMEGCKEGEIICDGRATCPPVTRRRRRPQPYTQDEIQRAAETAVADGTYKSLGEALFNLDLDSGAYSCARCHTTGWSYGNPQQSGGGAHGPEPHRTGRPCASSRTTPTTSTSSSRARRTASATASRARARAACPASARC